MAGAEPRDFCSQYPFGGEGFRPNAFSYDIYVDTHNFDVETFNWLLAGLYKQWLEFPKVQFFNNYVIDGGLVQQIHIFHFKLNFYTFLEWKFKLWGKIFCGFCKYG